MRKLKILTSAIVLAIVPAAAALAAGARTAREITPARDFARQPMSLDSDLSARLAGDRFANDRFALGRGFDREPVARSEEVERAAGHRKHAVIPVSGYIVAMDPATHDLTIKVPRHGDLVLEVVHASQLDQSGHRIHWGTLKPGDKVEVDYTKYGSKLVVDALAILKAPHH